MTDFSTAPTPPPPPSAIPEVQESHGSARRWLVWIVRAITYLVYAYVLLVEVILLIGFLLLLFGANPSSSFVQWAYRNLDSAMDPFRGIFSPVEIGIAGNDVPAVFETSILFAMIIYLIVAIALHALIDWLSGRLGSIDRRERAERTREDALIRSQALRDRAMIIEAERARMAQHPHPSPDTPVPSQLDH
ncbi:MAG: hypothetical protein AB8G26_01895 [Ilumatobacter sp.]